MSVEQVTVCTMDVIKDVVANQANLMEEKSYFIYA